MIRCSGLEEVPYAVWADGDGDDWVGLVAMETDNFIYCSPLHTAHTPTLPL